MRSKGAVLLAALFLAAAPSSAASRVGQLVYRLDQTKGAEQLRTIAALGRTASPEAAQALLERFDVRKASPRQSVAVVKALAQLRPAAALVPLLGAWDYLNSLLLAQVDLPAHGQLLRAEIASALGVLGDRRAAPPLVAALQDADPLVAQRAAESLGRLKDPRAVEPLMELAKRGGDLGQAAYEALGTIGDKRAIPFLEKIIKDEDRLARIQAAYALAIMGEERGRNFLLDLMLKEGSTSKVSVMTAYYLTKLDVADGLDALTTIFVKDSNPLQLAAVDAAGRSGNRRMIPFLLEKAGAKDALVRAAVARNLGRLGGPKAAGALQKIALDPDPSVSAAARAALTDLGLDD